MEETTIVRRTVAQKEVWQLICGNHKRQTRIQTLIKTEIKTRTELKTGAKTKTGTETRTARGMRLRTAILRQR